MLRYTNVKSIDLSDWDHLVSTVYGRVYNLQQQDGCRERQTVNFTVPDYDDYDYPNDTVPEEVNHSKMGVSFKAWLARDPKKPLDAKDNWDRAHGLTMWWERNFYPDMQMVANDLYERGFMEAGDYQIVIDW